MHFCWLYGHDSLHDSTTAAHHVVVQHLAGHVGVVDLDDFAGGRAVVPRHTEHLGLK